MVWYVSTEVPETQWLDLEVDDLTLLKFVYTTKNVDFNTLFYRMNT